MKTRKSSSLAESSDERGGGFFFDADSADRAVLFIERLCKHWKGEWAGQRLLLEPWQREFIRQLFGWKNPDGTRRYRTAYLTVAKKNGKSTLAAAIALYVLFADGEAGAEIYSAAADRGQAAIVFRDARRMVEQSRSLRSRCEIFRSSIFVPASQSRYEVISADAPTKHGFNAHAVIFDELHAQRTRELYDTLKGAGAARRQPLFLIITTAGNDRRSICYEVHERAKRIAAEPELDPSFLPVIFETGKEEDWRDEAVWAKANPNLGRCVKVEFLRAEFLEAKDSPAKQNAFRQLHLNQWTEQAVRWIDMDVWKENGGFVDPAALTKRECFAGLDLSSSTDVSALVLVFPPKADETLNRVLPFFWIPGENIARRVRRDAVPYDAWVREGWVTATQGNVVDQGFIRQKINELGKVYRIRELVYDRWGAQKISTELQDDGFTVVPFGQGFKDMSPAAREFERLLLRREIAHSGNPVLRWMASNVAVRRDPADNIKPDKAESADRIDGIVALVMAIGRAAVQGEIPQPRITVIEW